MQNRTKGKLYMLVSRRVVVCGVVGVGWGAEAEVREVGEKRTQWLK